MFAPLNGAPLNGSGSGLWASADANASAESVAEIRVYSAAEATVTASAQTNSTAVRRSLFEGGKLARSTIGIEATRLAAFDGTSTASADQSIEPIRAAWFDAPIETVGATSTGSATRLAWFNGSIASDATGTLDNDALTVYRPIFAKASPGQARSWLAESNLDLLRVRQIPASADTIARSISRALANTALGRSELVLNAETKTHSLSVNAIRDIKGSSVGTLEASSEASRIRIIEGGMPCVAEIHAAPTITTATGRYSYNDSTISAGAAGQTSNQVLRRPGFSTVSSHASVGIPRTYLRRSVQSSVFAGALSTLTSRNNSWHFGQGKAVGTAGLISDWQHYRWRGVSGVGVAEAIGYAENLHYRPTQIGSFEATSTSSAIGLAIRTVEDDEVTFSASTSSADNIRLAVSQGDPEAQARLEIEANGRRGRLMTGIQEANAESTSDGLKAVWRTGEQKANASIIKFIYRINADTVAPDNRTLYLDYNERLLVVEPSNREYRIQ